MKWPEHPGSRDFVCDEGHYTSIVGESHWNPWGSPDFSPTVPLKCGVQGCTAPGHLLSKTEQAVRDQGEWARMVNGKVLYG